MRGEPGRPRILVTGAGGFIGGRVFEALMQSDPWEPIPSVRRWATAARIGRHPVDPIQCDLLDPEQVRAALEGVHAVIHCAVGDRKATVEGTHNLLAACVERRITRVVHLSTIDVYGRAEGVVPESNPLSRTGREYGDSKIEAEEVCRKFVELGLEVVILRPTIVYGPFSDLWTLEFAQRFRDGDWRLPREVCQGRCNLVYVDDLVRACLQALSAPGVSGEAFNINGPDEVTWQEYFDALNHAMGLPPLPSPSPAGSRIGSSLTAPVRTVVKLVYRRFEGLALRLYKRSDAARRVMKGVERSLRKMPSGAEFDLYGRRAHFPWIKARALLGYEPVVPLDHGVHMSALWLRHHGQVEPRGR